MTDSKSLLKAPLAVVLWTVGAVVLIVAGTFIAFAGPHQALLKEASSSDLQLLETVQQSAKRPFPKRPAHQASTAIRHGAAVGVTATAVDNDFFEYLQNQIYNSSYPGVVLYTKHTAFTKKLKPLQGVEPLRAGTGPVYHDAVNYRYPIEVQCKERSTVAGRRSVFVAIDSEPSNFERRDRVRGTWLRLLKSENDTKAFDLVGYGFNVGLTQDEPTNNRLFAESVTYGDMIQVDVLDVYSNLALKVVGSMHWFRNHCKQADFIFKVDDDVFVNLRNLATAINDLDPSTMAIYGTTSSAAPMRVDKWKVTYEDWPWSDYPPYLSGGAMLIPTKIIEPLLVGVQITPFFHIDDLYLTGMCTEAGRISVRVARWFFTTQKTPVDYPCHMHKYVSWLADSEDFQTTALMAYNDFYSGATLCHITEGPGKITTVDASLPFQRNFTTVTGPF